MAGAHLQYACSTVLEDKLHLCGGRLKHVFDEGLADGQDLRELALDLHKYTGSTHKSRNRLVQGVMTPCIDFIQAGILGASQRPHPVALSALAAQVLGFVHDG